MHYVSVEKGIGDEPLQIERITKFDISKRSLFSFSIIVTEGSFGIASDERERMSHAHTKSLKLFGNKFHIT